MDGFEAYKTYVAIKNHFKTRSYDYFKYDGAVKVKQSSYESRKDKYFFEKASRKFKSKEEYIRYLVANTVSDESFWIGELFSNKCSDTFIKWRRNMESLTYQFKNEVSILAECHDKFDDLFLLKKGEHPYLYKSFKGNRISIDTCSIFNDITDFASIWEVSENADSLIIDFCRLIWQYRPFFNSFRFAGRLEKNNSKYKKIILDTWEK